MIASLRSPGRSQLTDQALEFGGERRIVLRRLLQRQPHSLPSPRALPPLLGLLRELRQGGLVPQPLGHDLVQPVHPGVDGQIHFLIGPPEHPPELLHQVAHHVPGQQFQLHAHLLLAIALLSPAVSARPIATPATSAAEAAHPTHPSRGCPVAADGERPCGPWPRACRHVGETPLDDGPLMNNSAAISQAEQQPDELPA
ncbi:hypothetical protein OIE67_27180 [Nonomuraea fuscirosea]|uniref:hypothetical protein n=1 Tax=Nonomuraea fuscirosea TaxID=1291556 RepID=UPI002DD7DE68|nr:hypothetical protein [Nonomuraea fuscirosea]WSA58177.1 hypothetical protein OIE67_27180 [Nonomuraea fuscirosea]